MQIHELTKRRKQRTDEAGLLKGITNAINAAKTGYTAAKGATGSTLAGVGKALGTLGQAATSPGFAAQSSKEANSAAGVAKYNELAKKYGWEPMKDPNAPGANPAATTASAGGAAQPSQAATAPEEVKQQAAAMVQQFTQEPDFSDLTAVLPDPGHILTVKTKNGGTAYKDENGQWFTNSIKGPVPANDKAKLYYEKLIDVDQYEQTLAPQAGQVTNTAGTNTGNKNKPMTEAVGNTKVQSIVNRLIQKNRAAQAAAEKAAANPVTATKVNKAKQQVDKAAAMTRKSAPNRKAKTNIVKQALMNYATAIIQAGGTTPTSDQSQAQPGTEQQGQGQQLATSGNKASPQEKQIAAQTLSKANLPGPEIVKAAAANPQVNTALKTATLESRKSLIQRLEEAIQMLGEEQVRITKDIHVRTAGGDYVKRASDQTWYDPKGVPIDPVKYASYVKKLDGTPQAQTQYQKDAAKAAQGIGPGGTDVGARNAAQTPPPPLPPPLPQAPAQAAAPAPQQPDPLQQMADQQKMQQWLRGRDVAGLNAQIADTTKQLRNAQIFGTGQEQYLQQQLAQLIAMKV